MTNEQTKAVEKLIEECREDLAFRAETSKPCVGKKGIKVHYMTRILELTEIKTQPIAPTGIGGPFDRFEVME